MKIPRTLRWLSMLVLLLLAPVVFYAGFMLPGLMMPFTGLSRGAQEIQLASGALVMLIYLGSVGVALTGRFRGALILLATACLIQVATLVTVVVVDPEFRRAEREAAIQERFDAAAATYPVQVRCNGGFAYLRQEGGASGFDVMLHRPAALGEFALLVAQYRVSEANRSCDVALIPTAYAVASDWFAACPEARAAFETLVDRVRRPTGCPYPTINHWPRSERSN